MLDIEKPFIAFLKNESNLTTAMSVVKNEVAYLTEIGSLLIICENEEGCKSVMYAEKILLDAVFIKNEPVMLLIE